jgi:hypothetical protein
VAQEIEQQFGLAAARAKVDIGDPDAPIAAGGRRDLVHGGLGTGLVDKSVEPVGTDI